MSVSRHPLCDFLCRGARCGLCTAAAYLGAGQRTWGRDTAPAAPSIRGQGPQPGHRPLVLVWGGKEKISHGDLVLKYLLLLASSRFCVWSRGEWLLGGGETPSQPAAPAAVPCRERSHRVSSGASRKRPCCQAGVTKPCQPAGCCQGGLVASLLLE